MEIKDNAFSRQFETFLDGNMIILEYSFQEKKIFLTKIKTPDNFDNEAFINDFLKNIMEIAYERNLKVVPILPKIATFFRKNPTYKDLLPPGIKM
jgi:predicted GNAT family acetyltransferase